MIINKIGYICAILSIVGALILTLIAAQKFDSHPAFAYGILVALSAVYGVGMLVKAFQKEVDGE